MRHHLQALEELPSDVIVHPRVVVTRSSAELILRQIAEAEPAGFPAAGSAALR